MNFLYDDIADPLEHRTWKITTLDPLNQPCSNCGSKEQIEMHHIKHIKTLNVKLSSYDKRKNKSKTSATLQGLPPKSTCWNILRILIETF